MRLTRPLTLVMAASAISEEQSISSIIGRLPDRLDRSDDDWVVEHPIHIAAKTAKIAAIKVVGSRA